MKVFAPKDGGNVSVGGVTIKVIDGQADTDGPIAAMLVEQFGFTYDGKEPVPANPGPSAAADRVFVFPNTWTAEQIADFKAWVAEGIAGGHLPRKIEPRQDPQLQNEQPPAPQPQEQKAAPAPLAPETPVAETGEPAKTEAPVEETHS